MQYIGEFSALGAAFVWSFSSFAFSAAANRIGTIQLNISRLSLAASLLFIAILIFHIDTSINQWHLLFLCISGIIGLIIGDTFLFKSFEIIGPRISMVLMSCNPAIAALIAYFVFGETVSAFVITGMIVTLIGIIFVINDHRDNSENQEFTKNIEVNSLHDEVPGRLPREKNMLGFFNSLIKTKLSKKGIMYAFMGALGQSVGLIFTRVAANQGQINGIVASFIRIASAAIIIHFMVIGTGRYKNPVKMFLKDKKAFIFVLIASILGPFTGVTLSYYAVVNTKMGIASTLMSTVPILMLPLAVIFHKEKLHWKAIVGAFVSVIGVALLFI
ncbi:MAG: DMT family transporter [Candidatus Kapabacteria bacterium]|nr:DMT family transporter [Candidatus Kapabacteria bacterium]